MIYQNRQRQSFDLWFPTSSLLEKSFSSIITSTTTWVKDDNWSAIIDDDIQYSVYFKNVNFMFFGGCVYQAFLWNEMFNLSFLDLLFFVWDRNCLKPEASNRYFKNQTKENFFRFLQLRPVCWKPFHRVLPDKTFPEILSILNLISNRFLQNVEYLIFIWFFMYHYMYTKTLDCLFVQGSSPWCFASHGEGKQPWNWTMEWIIDKGQSMDNWKMEKKG